MVCLLKVNQGLYSGCLFYGNAREEKGKYIYVGLAFFGHLIGAILAHAYTMPISAAFYNKCIPLFPYSKECAGQKRGTRHGVSILLLNLIAAAS